MRKHPDAPLFLIVAASLAVLLIAVVRLAGPGGPFDLTVPSAWTGSPTAATR